MSTEEPQTTDQAPRQPTEEELLAAYEAQVKQLRVEDVIIQTIISLLNLGGRKTGIAPGSEDERDLEQVRTAIEGVRALLPLAEPVLGPDTAQVRDALAQLQVTYAKLASDGDAMPAEGAADTSPAQSSGRLWVPGQ
jgi:hypothetical protein